jgi:hypothetical protein
MLLMKKFSLIFAIISLCTAAQAAETMKVYFIGNSLTMGAKPERVQALMAEKGVAMDFAAQLSGGKSLIRHKNYADEPTTKWITRSSFAGSEVGTYDKAFTEYKWDAVVLQLFSSKMDDDMEAIGTFVDLCVANDSCENFYIYSTWPGRPRPKDGDYALVDFDYSAIWEDGKNYASRGYVTDLMDQLEEKFPKVNFFLIPAGEVVCQLDKQIKADELPELFELSKRDPKLVPGWRESLTEAAGAGMFYIDPLHFKNGPGVVVSSTTIATVLGGQSPEGLSGSHFGMDDKADGELLEKIQRTIWETVTSDPCTGIKE